MDYEAPNRSRTRLSSATNVTFIVLDAGKGRGMIRFLFLILLASVVSTAPADAQEPAGKLSPDQLRWRTPVDPTGEYVYIYAAVDERRASGAFPPEGITAEFIGLAGPPC